MRQGLTGVMGGGQDMEVVLCPYGSVSSARCRRRMPEAVEPGMNSTGVSSGTREVLLLLMYMEDVFHWFFMALIVGFAW